MSEDQRRLAAIVFTDIVGYTRLTQLDEGRALGILDIHNELVRSVLKRHDGREVKTIGDSFLAEFESTLAATLCAVEIQQLLAKRDASADDSEKLQVRIGIHVGDVIHRGKDVLGDTVNIASRIQHLAEAGSICVSEEVYLQVRNKVPYSFEKLSNQLLRNVEPVMNLYLLSPVKKETHIGSPSSSRKMRLAVLPFSNISSDEKDEYFADGLTEELISVLSQVRGLRIIARTSVNHYKGTNKGVAQIADELQVGSVLEGSVRKVGTKVRVTAQLVDVATQEHVWSDKYDRELDDVFSIQSNIAMNVADALKVRLLQTEQERIERKETSNTDAHTAYLKGRTLLHERSEKSLRDAKEHFEQALKLDPRYARAYDGLADAQFLLGSYHFAPITEHLAAARQNVKKALELDPEMAEAHASLGVMLCSEYRFKEGEAEFVRALALNPSYATARHWYSNCLVAQRRVEEALEQALAAEANDPFSMIICKVVAYQYLYLKNTPEVVKRLRRIAELDPNSAYTDEILGTRAIMEEDYDLAIFYVEKVKRYYDNPAADGALAAIYALQGNREEALRLRDRVLAMQDGPEKPYSMALASMGIGDMDEAYRWLYLASEQPGELGEDLRYNPLFKRAREDGRYPDLLRKLNLEP